MRGLPKNIDAMLAIQATVAKAGIRWDRDVRDAIRFSELSDNLWVCDRERFDLILESELSYFTDMKR
jgi:hypothetical protein|tara:strand:- start:248 stop:448 length:201 start_codon:yes stop_codon:yes gene_type:complete